jgi:hypothetical protein
MDETSYVAEWLYETLSEDVTLSGLVTGGVHEDPAPQGSAFPFLVFSLISALDVQVHNAMRIMVDSLWLVKAVDQNGSFSRTRTIMNRVDEILHRASGNLGDAFIYSCVREESIRMTEVDDGKPYRHLGAQYRVHVQYTGE